MTETEVLYWRGLKRLFKEYERSARRKEIFWKMTREEFHDLVTQACAYCGKPPGKRARSYSHFVAHGLDRKDNRQGYSVANCVPCCRECNGIKSDQLSFEEMLVVGEALSRYREGVTKIVTPTLGY